MYKSAEWALKNKVTGNLITCADHPSWQSNKEFVCTYASRDSAREDVKDWSALSNCTVVKVNVTVEEA